MKPDTSLLDKIVCATSRDDQTITVTNLAQLLACATVLPSAPVREVCLDRRERFHLNLVEELFREVAFYYRQFKRKSPVGESRLVNALNSLANVCGPIDNTVLEYFLDSLPEEDEGGWFLLATFADFPAVASDLFAKRLQERLTGCTRLPKGAKTALQDCKAGNLGKAVKPIVAKMTVAVKQEVQDILSHRKEPVEC